MQSILVLLIIQFKIIIRREIFSTWTCREWEITMVKVYLINILMTKSQTRALKFMTLHIIMIIIIIVLMFIIMKTAKFMSPITIAGL